VLAAVVVLGAAVAPAAQARRVRVFAVGPRFELGWVQSPETFRAKLLALMDRRRRGGGAPPVQRGVDDVASHRARRATSSSCPRTWACSPG